MASQTTEANLCKAMIGLETTDNWDVLVSYSEVQLNAFLKKAWSGLSKVVSLKIDVAWVHGSKVFCDEYELSLENPQLQFKRNDAGPWARLTMPVSGVQRPKGSKIKSEEFKIPKGVFKLCVDVPLCGVSGQVSNNAIKQTNQKVIHFEDTQNSSYYVTFNFKNEGCVWEVMGDASAQHADSAAILNHVLDDVKNYFKDLNHTDHISLSLAEISNEKHENASDLLKPVSFALASQPGVLNVFIATKGGGRGNGSDARQFGLMPGSHYVPIPEGFGASIIVSRHIFVRKFLIPEITKVRNTLESGGKAVKETKKEDSGVTLETFYSLEKIIHLYHPSLPPGPFWDYKPIEGSQKLETHNPLVLKIFDDLQHAKTTVPLYNWSWSGKGTLEYDVDATILGKARAKLSFDLKVKDMKRNLLKIGEDKLELDLAFIDEEQPTAMVEIHGKDQKVFAAFPFFSVSLKDLDYFRVSNVFWPGKRMINIEKVRCPGDLLMLGKVATA